MAVCWSGAERAEENTPSAAASVRFMGLELHIGADVLVPRAETELLAQSALASVAESGLRSPRIVDMCCGAGNLAIALAVALPAARVWAVDLTAPCVETTRANVANHALGDRVTVLQGDLFAALAGQALEGTVDVVVCNPPYISTGRLARDLAPLLRREPREAFDAGPYGVAIHQRLVTEAARFLRRDGWLLCEFGADQGRQIRIMVDRSRRYADVRMITDAVGEERVAAARSLG